MRWKALAEIYTMHYFAPFWNRIPKTRKTFAPFWNRIPKNEENHGGEKILVQSWEKFAPFSNLNFFVKNRQNFFAIELMNIH
jgi:hypothetical protein